MLNLEWVGLFRDGRSISGGYEDLEDRLEELNNYLMGTLEKPKRHFLLWFKLVIDGETYIVSFDDDGDAFIETPDGRMLMTEYKIRSASLVFYVEDNRIQIGFAGVNTADKPDGKAVIIANLLANNLMATDIIPI